MPFKFPPPTTFNFHSKVNPPVVKTPVVKPPVAKPPTPQFPVFKKGPNGLFYNQQGKLVNKQNQLVNDKGQRVNDAGQLINNHGHAVNDKGKLINAQNHTINSRGALVNDDGHLVDGKDRLVNPAGRLINTKGEYVDQDQRVVNKEGYLIDAQKRPLDKDGKVARDMTTAQKGNNEPHEHFLTPVFKKKINSWQGKDPASETPKKSTVAEVAQRMTDADKLIKSGVIPKSPSAAQVARDAGISAGITGVVSAPISVASYSGSVYAGEAIKAAYNPTPLTPPAPTAPPVAGTPAGSPADPSAASPTAPATALATAPTTAPATVEDVALQVLYPRVNEAQEKVFLLANSSIALRFGDTQSGYIPATNWPSTTLGRLEEMERLLDFAEEHTHEISDEYLVHFKAYVRPEALPEGEARFEVLVKTIELRIKAIDKTQSDAKERLEKLKKEHEQKQEQSQVADVTV